MHDTGFVNTELHLTGLGIANGLRDIGCHGANFGVGHQAAWSQNLTQGSHHTHGVRSRNHHVKGHVTRLDAGGQIVHANHVCTRGLGFFCLGALCKHGDTGGFTRPVGHDDRATNDLV